jgi:hypothetical protein
MMERIPNKRSRVSWALGLLLILCLILVPTSIQARGLKEQEVRAAVETWVRKGLPQCSSK